MTKANKQLIFTLCLLPVLALTVVNAIKQTRGTNRATPEPIVTTAPEERVGEEPTGEEVKPVPNSVPEEDLKKQRKRLTMEWGRDPFFGVLEEDGNGEQDPEYAGDTTGDIPEIYLTAISWMSENPIALINRQDVSEGDFILGYEVVDIQKNKVILRKGNKEHVLTPEE